MPTLPDPLGGLHTDTAVSKQPKGTSRQVENMRPIDKGGRRRLASRGGHADILGGATLDSSGAPVRALVSLSRQKKLTTYLEKTTPSKAWEHDSETVVGVKTDSQGNTYWLSGRDRVTKRNSAGVELWQLTLPLVDESQSVRAIDVAPDGTLFCGVSEGTRASDSRIWSFAEVRTGEAPVQLSEVSGVGLVQDCKYHDGYLYTIQDYPDENRASLVIYREALSGQPVEDRRNDQIAWPTAGLDVGPDGAAYIASPESLRRGLASMPRKKSFELGDLAQLGDRLWARWRADTPSVTITHEDGDEVQQIDDLSGNGRHIVRQSAGAGVELIKKDGQVAKLRFDPSYLGPDSGNTGSRMQSIPNVNSNDEEDRIFTLLPSYSGARFAAFFLFRRTDPSDTAISLVLQQDMGTNGNQSVKLRGNFDEAAANTADLITLSTGGTHQKDAALEGYFLVTILWDIDGAGTCIYRVNGTPWSRFNVAFDTEGTTTEQTDFGFTSVGSNNGTGLKADFIEGIVLRDYVDDDDGQTKLIDAPTYPDGAWSVSSDTEVERIEGAIMWEYGVQDYLDDGTQTGLDVSSATAQPWPHPFHLRKRFSFKDAAVSAGGTGSLLTKTGAFADYTPTAITAPSTKYDTIEVYETDGTANTYAILQKVSDDQIETTTSIPGATVASGVFLGYIANDVQANTGGPPQKSGRPTTTTAYWRDTISFPGMLQKWAGGKLEASIARTGGVGHAVHVREIDDTTHVWSYGPNYRSITSYLHRLNGSLVAQASLAAPSGQVASPDYKYARMQADKLGTIYFPWTDADSTYSGSLGWTNLDFSYGLRTHLIDQVGYAVAVDPNVPEYESDPVALSEFVYVGTVKQYRICLVQRTLDAGSSPRERVDLGIAGGKLYRFDGGSPVLIGPALYPDSPWTQMHEFAGEVFMTDGSSAKVYTKDDALEDWTATSAGELPRGFKLMMVWNGYIWVARTEEDPFFWARSEKDNARGWDLSPVTVTVTQAAAGPLSPAGRTPHMPTALIPWTDATRDERTGSLAVIGCDHSIWMMEGEVAPGAGGTIYMKTASMGIAFGMKPWAISRQNVLYFINDSGQFCIWPVGSSPRPLSEGRVDQRFQDIDFTKYMPYLVYDRDARGVHVYLVPYAAAHSEKLEHYFFCEESHGIRERGRTRSGAFGSFWPDKWDQIGHQPICALVRDGDAPEDRSLILGCSDGYLREHSPDHEDDDGYPIRWDVVYGPLIGNESGDQGLFSGYQVEMAEGQYGGTASVYAHDRARDSMGASAVDFRVDPGLNDIVYKPARGSYCYVRLRGTSRAAVEAVRVEAIRAKAGLKRRRV